MWLGLMGVALVASMQVKMSGVGALQRYKELFGRTHLEVDPFEDRSVQLEGIRETKKRLEGPKAFHKYLWTMSSPLCCYEHFVLTSHLCYPTYEITEDCGRLIFPSSSAAKEFFQQHTAAIQKVMGTGKEKVIFMKPQSEEQYIDVEGSGSAEENVDFVMSNDEASDDDGILQALLAREMNLTKEKRDFISNHKSYFIARQVDPSIAHVMPSKLPVTKFVGPHPSITVFDILSDEPSSTATMSIFEHVEQATEVMLVDALPALNEIVQIESVPITEAKRSWYSDEELISAFQRGEGSIEIFGTRYTIVSVPKQLDADIVVTCASGLQGLMKSETPYFLAGLASLSHVMNHGSLIVNGAGDFAFIQSSYQRDLAVLLAKKYKAFINVVGLAADGANVLPTSNQPGMGPLANCTVSAIATDNSTINAAAYVSTCIAIMKTRVPFDSWERIAECILQTASPIILVTDAASVPFERPVVLKNLLAVNFKPGMYIDLPSGESMLITREVFNRSRQKFGMGSFNLSAALSMATGDQKISWKKNKFII